MSRPARRPGSLRGTSRSWSRLLFAVAAILLAAWLLRPAAQAPRPPPAAIPDTSGTSAPAQVRTALPDFLPAEAVAVIRQVQSGARFAHPQDGSVFGNRERRLPRREHGYYREYTVPTPGLKHRGARRIVTGGDPPAEWYYTADHYESFRPFHPPAREATR